MRLKNRIYQIVSVAPAPGDRASRFFDFFMISLIFSNVIALMLDTVKDIHNAAPGFFHWFEQVSVAIFAVEYILRVWTCTESSHYSRPVTGRLRFMATPLAIIDLVAILPFFLATSGIDLRTLRMIRLVKLLRVAKLGRYSRTIQIFGKVISDKKEDLLVSLALLLLLLLLSSSVMYFAETESQADEFSSIPAAMWWGVATLTTVGYGDVTPVTTAGKIFGAIIAILGIGMFALPTSILGAGFVEQLEKKNSEKTCPHCGEVISS